ncbi:HNH endonuclease signature motif containing protein [Acetobacter indonesiensis]|uniref:HNH endonuclease signature motif containing protein n=1 Tax=Acetobacter indonesiensis TaxID=104101 RepID=UPI0020A354A1|nr:HNH endonuclease signature motif containing protein [Acetobacter indonesiensis]MCP1232008.1 HNH endonuclease [Acetobacter indonesiensis]
MTRQTTSVIDRLKDKLKETAAPYGLPSPCQTFAGAKIGPDGHGAIWHNGTREYAHRVAWKAEHGPIPIDQETGKPFVILHLCDNPACCNVDHMEVGTQTENVQDSISKGRHGRPSATMNKLNRAVELADAGKTTAAIADELKISEDEAKRLLAFHAEDASLYAAERIALGPDTAEEMRRYRLTREYEAVISAMGLLNEARHIKQIDLCV